MKGGKVNYELPEYLASKVIFAARVTKKEITEKSRPRRRGRMPAIVQTLFTYYHASYFYIIHGGRERKHYKKTDNQNPSPETAKKQPEVAFTLIAPPIDNNKRLGHLSRADWPAGKAGDEDCLLDEDDEPQVDELDPEAEEEQGYRTDWPTDLPEKSTVATSISENALIAIIQKQKYPEDM
jgi:hypothetical protein